MKEWWSIVGAVVAVGTATFIAGLICGGDRAAPSARRWFVITQAAHPPVRVCGLRIARESGCVRIIDWDQIVIADVCGPDVSAAAEGVCRLEDVK